MAGDWIGVAVLPLTRVMWVWVVPFAEELTWA
jgi:hypothetical protein